jgi:hypothetical protein
MKVVFECLIKEGSAFFGMYQHYETFPHCLGVTDEWKQSFDDNQVNIW